MTKSMTAKIITTKRDLKDTQLKFIQRNNKIDQRVFEDSNPTESKTFQQFKTNNY